MLASDFVNIIDKCINEDLPFALYRIPESSEVVLLLSRRDVEICDFEALRTKGAGFVLHPFKCSKDKPIFYINADVVLNIDINQLSNLDITLGVKCRDFFLENNIDKEEYIKRVEKIINSINKGILEKLVFAKTKTVNYYLKSDLRNLFFNIEQNDKAAFVYLINIPGMFSWCGASPEMLLVGDDTDWNTVALAGTQKYNAESVNDINWGEKEIKEQAFVCDYIENNIVKTGFPFSKKATKTVRAGGVVHIETKYNIKGKDIEFWELVSALHPTPAVCGIPKEKALELIEEIEEKDRFYYSGFLGPIGIRSQRNLFVNLRCAMWKDNELSLFVGGGITGESIPEREWDETELKAETLIKLF